MTFNLARSLNLAGWNEGLPNYTPEESAAIDREVASFQKMVSQELGGEAKFHPEVVPILQRKLVGDALAELAGNQWRFSEDIPTNWKDLVSTYLKAWASRLNPLTLLNLGELLVKAGLRSEAKKAFQVILLFPTYADAYYGGKPDSELVENIINSAEDALRNLG